MDEIPFKRRLKLWLMAWAVGLVAAGFPHPVMIVWVWVFPLGLMEAFSLDNKIPGEDAVYFLVWLPYIGLTIAALLARRRADFTKLLILLCLLLAVNVAGCRHMNANMDF